MFFFADIVVARFMGNNPRENTVATDMDSRLLEYFLRIAELGSINRAAADLNQSQSAMSRHVGTLEREMETQLFTRTRGGVVLTDSGKLLAERARPLLRQYAMLKDQIGEMAAGRVAIGLPAAWLHIFTAPWVQAMRAGHSGVALRLHDAVSNVLHDYLATGLLDLCVLPFATTAVAGCRQTALVREPLVVVGAADAGFSPDEAVPLSRLDGAPLVLPTRPNLLRAQVEHTMARRGLRFKLAVEADALADYLELARRGVGCTVIPASAVVAHDHGGGLSWAPLRGLTITWALCENQARIHSPAVAQARRVVFEVITSALADGLWLGAEPVVTAAALD